MKSLLTTFLLLTISGAQAEQIEKLRKGEVFITLADVPGTKLSRGTIVGVIEASISDIWSVITDYEHYKDFMPRGKDSRMLEQRKDGVKYYSLLHMPWPISDVSFDCNVDFAPDHRSLKFNMVPGTGKGVKQFDGSWELSEFEGNSQSTLAHYSILFEPETHYPRWVMNLGTKATLGKIVEAVRNRLKKVKKEAAH